jgi:hypothetical protein
LKGCRKNNNRKEEGERRRRFWKDMMKKFILP